MAGQIKVKVTKTKAKTYEKWLQTKEGKAASEGIGISRRYNEGMQEKKEKKKPKKCATGTVYNAKLKKCVSNKKKGETLLEWKHRNMLKSITKKKPSMS